MNQESPDSVGGSVNKMILEFFIGSDNSHLLQSELNTEEYKNKQRMWQEDLVKIAQERDNFAITS